MPLIQRIKQMQGIGLKDEEIFTQLEEQGFTPKEINEAFEQSKIKAAVSQPDALQGMQPSVMSPIENEDVNESSQLQQTKQLKTLPPPAGEQAPQQVYPEQQTYSEQYAKQVQYPAPYPEQQAYAEQQPYAEQYPQQDYPQQNYPEQLSQQTYPQQYPEQQVYPEQYPQYADFQYQEYPQYPPQAPDTNIVAEIAEQIVAEKIQKTQTQISDTIKFKTEAEIRITDLNERLRRIELIIDRLQSSIIGKIGNYEKDISNLKQEISATQDSFSKVLTPLAEKHKHKNPKKTEHKPAHKETRRKKSDALTHYLRR